MTRKANRILLPFTKSSPSGILIKIASQMIGGPSSKLIALGLVEVPEDLSLSYGAIPARRFRFAIKNFFEMGRSETVEMKTLVGVARVAGPEIIETARREDCNLIFLEWNGRRPKAQDRNLSLIDEVADGYLGDILLVKPGKTDRMDSILLLIRGGIHAKLVLNIANSIAKEHGSKISLLHVASLAFGQAEKDKRDLETYLKKDSALARDVEIISIASEDVTKTTLEFASGYDVVIMGATAEAEKGALIGPISENIARKLENTLIIARSSSSSRTKIFESEKESKEGAKVKPDISTIVDRWFAENTFHVSEFDDIDELLELKVKQKLTISLGLPTLNEAETIGNILSILKGELVEKYPLLDEIAILDSKSIDGTREIAKELGVKIITDDEVLASHGSFPGKGESLWKSLYALNGDIIVWVDSDIKNMNPGFVYGLVGPLLKYNKIKYVKGFYHRPIKEGGKYKEAGGGRVTELVARPIINLFFPELSGMVQPLSGEYAGRRGVLEQVGFYSGYGVEIGLLINILEKFGLQAFGQVDLIKRIHRNQNLAALSKMSFGIIGVVIDHLEREKRVHLLQETNKSMKLIHQDPKNFFLEVKEIADIMRPPMIEVEEYVKKFKKGL
ncbi:MAG: glucosyl-3-phosphoglycerate synthase [Actinomycetota bacterium]|nr:glucosyl-3-phosphoglycerate synthase [Actinomycetota bacterium]